MYNMLSLPSSTFLPSFVILYLTLCGLMAVKYYWISWHALSVGTTSQNFWVGREIYPPKYFGRDFGSVGEISISCKTEKSIFSLRTFPAGAWYSHTILLLAGLLRKGGGGGNPPIPLPIVSTACTSNDKLVWLLCGMILDSGYIFLSSGYLCCIMNAGQWRDKHSLWCLNSH